MSAQNVIKHVVLLLMENHSFDQRLGCVQSEYPALDGVDVESQSPRFNLDLAGNKVFQLPTDQQQVELDPKHENRFVLDQIANGNSGFVTDFQKNVSVDSLHGRQNVRAIICLAACPNYISWHQTSQFATGGFLPCLAPRGRTAFSHYRERRPEEC